MRSSPRNEKPAFPRAFFLAASKRRRCQPVGNMKFMTARELRKPFALRRAMESTWGLRTAIYALKTLRGGVVPVYRPRRVLHLPRVAGADESIILQPLMPGPTDALIELSIELNASREELGRYLYSKLYYSTHPDLHSARMLWCASRCRSATGWSECRWRCPGRPGPRRKPAAICGCGSTACRTQRGTGDWSSCGWLAKPRTPS